VHKIGLPQLEHLPQPEGARRDRPEPVPTPSGERRPLLSPAVKRLIDVVGACLLLLALLPLLLVLALAIRLDSAGSPLFLQERVGQGGRRFKMLKLRSMYVDNDDRVHRAYVAALIAGDAQQCGGGLYKLDDPRITGVGRYLRRYSIDELPQLWNVIRGDLSLVGPRPPLPSEVELYDEVALERLRVRPGLTGLWQVNGRSSTTFQEMVALDVRYSREWTLWLDLKILARTPLVVLRGRNAA
jgi:lipopolysaccharide/colanic/teichoic acid biosynthesis glycosyltransferase